MKTLHEIKLMISECQDQGADLEQRRFIDKRDEKKRKRAIKAFRTKAAQLKTVVLYLETDPQAEFLQNEVVKLTGRKNAIMKFMPKQ